MATMALLVITDTGPSRPIQEVKGLLISKGTNVPFHRVVLMGLKGNYIGGVVKNAEIVSQEFVSSI